MKKFWKRYRSIAVCMRHRAMKERMRTVSYTHLDKTDGGKKELYNGFFNMFGIGKGGSPWITKQSICNQFYSDLVTKVQQDVYKRQQTGRN